MVNVPQTHQQSNSKKMKNFIDI